MAAVIYLSGRSMNDALGALGRAHRPLFEELGCEYVEVNFGNPEGPELLNRTLRTTPVAFAYAPLGLGAQLSGERPDGSQVNLWAANGIPYLSVSGDSPAYFFERHVMPTPWHAALYVYPEHLDLRTKFASPPALYAAVPPVPIDTTPKGDIDFRRKEGGKLLFLKNGNDPEKLVETWRSAMPPSTFLLLADMASELASAMESGGCDIDACVCERFAARGWRLDAMPRLRLFCIAQLDDYLRRLKSTMIADAIADFPVVIQGFNWDHMDFSRRRATFVAGGDFTRSRQQIVESLGMIDMSPNTERAPHDRAMRAFGLYTLCLTNRQSFFDAHIDDPGRFTYRFNRDEIKAKVADVLAHPKRYVEIGIDVAEQFRRDRRPVDLAQFMLDTASHVRFACGSRPEGLQDYFSWPPIGLS